MSRIEPAPEDRLRRFWRRRVIAAIIVLIVLLIGQWGLLGGASEGAQPPDERPAATALAPAAPSP